MSVLRENGHRVDVIKQANSRNTGICLLRENGRSADVIKHGNSRNTAILACYGNLIFNHESDVINILALR